MTTTSTALAPINWESELKGAGMLVKSGLVPKDIRSPEAALFVILAGRDLGLSPVQSLRSIRPIQGRIECSADLQLGLFHRDGGKSRFLQLDAKGAVLELNAPWLTQPHRVSFGQDDAKRAGLMSNANYAKYPQAMFRSRAITQGLKDIGYMLGAGVYAPGEVGGNAYVDVNGEVLPMDVSDVGTTGPHTGTDGAVEALNDEEREFIVQTGTDITNHVVAGEVAEALKLTENLEPDEKVALWAILDRPTRKALKEAAKATATPVRTVDDAIKAVKDKDFDLAYDIASGLPERDKRFVESEIEAAQGVV